MSKAFLPNLSIECTTNVSIFLLDISFNNVIALGRSLNGIEPLHLSIYCLCSTFDCLSIFCSVVLTLIYFAVLMFLCFC